MRLELTRETRKDNSTWYFIYIDGKPCSECFTASQEHEARQKFRYLKENAQPEETIEVLDVFET